MLILGEIRTCLLRNSSSVRQTVVGDLLGLIPGEPVWMSERPMAHALSPEVIRGVDCPLPTSSGTRVRGVGTVAAHAVISAGRVLQGSVTARVERSNADHRLPWPHYLGRPGVVEMIGRALGVGDLAEGFLREWSSSAFLDLGSVSERLIDGVQMSPRLDHAMPFRSARTRMRWTAVVGDEPARIIDPFTVEGDTTRTISLTVRPEDLPAAVRFCEDLALHDWVLTTLLRIVERGDLGSLDGQQVVERLRPAVDHLMHVWMPGAHVPDSMMPLWEALERRPGFTRQWTATVNRIRDQLALRNLIAFHGMDAVAGGEPQRSGGVGVPSPGR
ncbi:SCO2521 family protein [Actinocrispum wychmicini]|uniref:Uncharacterized protein n=1 Tax=Actinocrispum wychmicini TaxID=1213861 RepID=A0A4R2IT48_9PSEU|nr:SCO2521 family protein [Actinocrispum wychmicini]TCO47268.1 hypothetical protein EV192_1178 [Actinocrispum wychmicini]